MAVHVAVGLLALKVEIGAVRLPVGTGDILGLALIRLHDGLGLANVAGASILGALHQYILLDHICIGLCCELFTLAGHLHLAGDDTQALVTVQGRVCDLRLEREVRKRCHVDIFDL